MPDSVKASRQHAVEEAVAMAAALTVFDALRRFLSFRQREEVLAGRGPAAKALLRRSPPRPKPPARCLDSRGDSPEEALADMRAMRDLVLPFELAQWQETISTELVSHHGQPAFYSNEAAAYFEEGQSLSWRPDTGDTNPWLLRKGEKAWNANVEQPVVLFRPMGNIEALDLANRGVQGRKRWRRPKYAAAKRS